MFNNPFQPVQNRQNDPFDNLGEIKEKQITESVENSPFNNSAYNEAQNNAELHFVEPHYVMSYKKADGTHVEGYWRDGDGDTSVDQDIDSGGGYLRSNPDGDLSNNLDGI